MKPRPTELPALETERLLLRAMCADDAPALFAIYGDPEVMRYAGDEPFPDGEALEWAVAVARLARRLEAASAVDAPRVPTRPSRAARTQRRDTKRRRGTTKALRGRVRNE